MSDIFVSYSRRDAEDFVRHLHRALTAQGRDVWVDWEDIPKTAEWWEEIKAAIASSNTFVFIISPSSIASNVCQRELDYALANNKKIIPVVRKNVDEVEIPPAIAARNWIFFREVDDFDQALVELNGALDTDLDWLRMHTRILVRAREWEEENKDQSLLLRGKELAGAEAWLAQPSPPAVEPLPLQMDYLFASRKSATRRQRGAISIVLFGFVIAVILAVVSVLQRNEAIRQRERADRERRTAVSRRLASDAMLNLSVDPELSLLLALESVKTQPTSQGVEALRESLLRAHLIRRFSEWSGEVPTLATTSAGDFATIAEESSVKVVDLGDGSTRAYGPGDFGQISNDGRLLLVRKGRAFRIQRVEDQRLLWRSKLAFGGSVLFTPDSRLVVGERNGLRLWIAGSGKRAGEIRLPHDYDRVRFNPNGSHFIAGRGHVIAGDGDVLGTGLGADNATWGALVPGGATTTVRHRGMTDVAASRDGTTFVTVGASDTRVWNRHGALQKRLPIRYGISASFDPSGSYLAVGSFLGTPTVWDVDKERKIASLKGHSGRVYSVSFSPDGRFLVTGSEDKTARVWETRSGELVDVLRHTGRVVEARFTADGRRIITMADPKDALRVWRFSPLQRRVELRGHSRPVHSIEFSPAGDLVVTASADVSAVVWDSATGDPLNIQRGATLDVPEARFNADGSLAIMGNAGQSNGPWGYVWRPETGERVATLRGQGDSFEVQFVGGDEVTMTSGIGIDPAVPRSAARSVRMWDAISGEELAKFTTGTTFGSFAATASHDGRLVAFAHGKNRVRVFDWKTRQLLAERQHRGPVEHVVFDPTDRLLATAGGSSSKTSDHTILLWPWAEEDLDKSLVGHTAAITALSFSPDATLLASASRDGSVRLWPTQGSGTGTILGRHSAEVADLQFSPDGALLASASADGSARVWSVAEHDEVALLRGAAPLVDVAFSRDAERIAVAGEDGVPVIYPNIEFLDTAQLIELAETRTTRQLTKGERSRFLPSD